MIYFMNTSWPVNKSGIEHAELKRMQLFNQHHVKCMLMTNHWDGRFHLTAHESGIDDDQLLNMFDYYQGNCHVKSRTVTYQDVDLGMDNVRYQEDKDHLRYLAFRQNGQLLARINYDPEFHNQVLSTEMFDGAGNLYAVDNYDYRGFKSRIDWYSPDNKVERTEWIDRDGKVIVEEYNEVDPDDKKGQKMKATGYLLRDRNGKVVNFRTFHELYLKFLNDVNATGHNVFILDRSLNGDEELLHLARPAFKVFHLHNSQAVDVQDELHSTLNDNYEYDLWNIEGFDAVISSTQKQTDDVIKRFHPKHPHMYTIPVGIVPDAQLNAPRVPVSQRTPGKVIIVARISYEKQMPRIVRSLGMIKKDVPNVSLDIWGYTNSEKDKDAIKKAAKECGMTDAVHFNGYTTHLPKVYDSARIFALASTMEGFNLAIMEAISHGVVGVTYDTNYGPNSIIEDGVNGYVVPYNDEKAMAKRIRELLLDDKKLQQFSTAAYDSAKRYSGDNVWAGWQKLVDDAKEALGED